MKESFNINMAPYIYNKEKVIKEIKSLQSFYTSLFFSAIYSTYMRSLEVFDMADEAGLVRQQTKKAFKQYDKIVKQRISSLKRGCETTYWNTLNDTAVDYNSQLDNDVMYLSLACKNTVDKFWRNAKNSQMTGLSVAVSIMWMIADSKIKALLDAAGKDVGFDMQTHKAFEYTLLADVGNAWNRFAALLSPCCEQIGFGEDEMVITCTSHLTRRMFSLKLKYDSYLTGIGRNLQRLKEDYGAELVEKEEQEMKQMITKWQK